MGTPPWQSVSVSQSNTSLRYVQLCLMLWMPILLYNNSIHNNNDNGDDDVKANIEKDSIRHTISSYSVYFCCTNKNSSKQSQSKWFGSKTFYVVLLESLFTSR